MWEQPVIQVFHGTSGDREYTRSAHRVSVGLSRPRWASDARPSGEAGPGMASVDGCGALVSPSLPWPEALGVWEERRMKDPDSATGSPGPDSGAFVGGPGGHQRPRGEKALASGGARAGGAASTLGSLGALTCLPSKRNRSRVELGTVRGDSVGQPELTSCPQSRAGPALEGGTRVSTGESQTSETVRTPARGPGAPPCPVVFQLREDARHGVLTAVLPDTDITGSLS